MNPELEKRINLVWYLFKTISKDKIYLIYFLIIKQKISKKKNKF